MTEGAPAAAVVGAGRGRRRTTLRHRLTVGLLLLVTLVLVGVGAVTVALLRDSLVQRVDQALTQSLQGQLPRGPGDARGGGSGGSGADDLPAPRFLPPGTLVLRTSPAGVPSGYLGGAEGGSPGTATLSAQDLRALGAVGAQPSDVDLSTLGHYRVVATTAPDGDTVLVGLPLASVDATVRTIVLVELASLLGALLLVAGIGTWFIRRELAPLEHVATAARGVADLPLSTGDAGLPDRVQVEGNAAEVHEVADAVNEMLDHVDTSLRARAATEARLRQFVADASHELRTPLVSIRGYAELARRVDSSDPDERAAGMARIEAEATRMGVLVDDLLLLARLDQGRPLLREPVDLAVLAVDAAADAQAADPGRPVALDVPGEPAWVLGDEGRLRQVLVNLMGNVRQHTPPGTPAAITVRPTGERVLLEVSDQGPGVPAAFLPHAFERFARADESRARASGGSGLGLSIVSAVVAALDGTVRLASRPGSTVVTVDLPAARPA